MKFRKWVTVTLSIIAFLSFCIMGSDAEDLGVFFISHIIATIIFAGSCLLLNKYGDLD